MKIGRISPMDKSIEGIEGSLSEIFVLLGFFFWICEMTSCNREKRQMAVTP